MKKVIALVLALTLVIGLVGTVHADDKKIKIAIEPKPNEPVDHA